jgi:uncharacterized protein with HEPN domain
MAARSLIPRLTDIVEAIERIHGVLENISVEAFETDWRRQWLVERGIEIISEASRHLTDEMKARHPEIPWQKVAAIGNVLRHNYEKSLRPSFGSWRKPIYQRWRRSQPKLRYDPIPLTSGLNPNRGRYFQPDRRHS